MRAGGVNQGRLRARVAGLAPSDLRRGCALASWSGAPPGPDVGPVHFTWSRDQERVYAVLPAIEAALLPLGARPHWGKCFVAGVAELEPLYPRMADFRALRDRVDPDRVFGNTFLERVIG